MVTPRKKKILILLEATLGGTRRHVVDLLKCLDRESYDVTFGYSTSRSDENFFRDLGQLKQTRGVKLVEIPMRREIAPLSDLRVFLFLCNFIWKGKFDLVHCHSSKAGFLGRLATKLVSPRTPTLYTPNSMALNLSRFYALLERFASFFTDRIIAVSDSEKDEIVGNQIAKSGKVSTIWSGVETPGISPGKRLNAELGGDEQTRWVISVGRLTAQKDPMTFFNAIAHVLGRSPQVRAVWIGDGELRTQAEQFISEHKLADRCHLLGWRTDVAELLSEAHVFVLSSVYESFGYVSCEAMACQLPVVATNVTGTRDIIVDGDTGFLVPPQDPSAMAEKILYLIHNEPLRKRMGEKGGLRVEEKFSLRKMVQDTQALYRQLILNSSSLRGSEATEAISS